MPVVGSADILHWNWNFVFQLTLWSCTPALENNNKLVSVQQCATFVFNVIEFSVGCDHMPSYSIMKWITRRLDYLHEYFMHMIKVNREHLCSKYSGTYQSRVSTDEFCILIYIHLRKLCLSQSENNVIPALLWITHIIVCRTCYVVHVMGKGV